MSTLATDLKSALSDLREQGMQLSDINPISALADIICERLYHGKTDHSEIQALLDELGNDIWAQQATKLASQTNLGAVDPQALTKHADALAKLPLDQPLYRAVFTAHPVFSLQQDHSAALCKAALDSTAAPNTTDTNARKIARPPHSYTPRQSVSLSDEHDEAMQALINARQAIAKINNVILEMRAVSDPDGWRKTIPQMLGVSTWVGYDLDGRSDIGWADSLCLRLREKRLALDIYLRNLTAIQLPDLSPIIGQITAEVDHCAADLERLENLPSADNADPADNSGAFITAFSAAINSLTERTDKLVASQALADDLHNIALAQSDDDTARAIMLVAGDVATHGFGMGEIHLRINAVQLRNAMRSLDGRPHSMSDGSASPRILIDRLATRIATEEPWQINFSVVDQETATARRQLMLAAQFLKHIDTDQPIRLLIAECERPITYMSALYLAHKFGIADRLDISPLFETTFGLEHGTQMMTQLFGHKVVQDYVRQRGRVAIQTGFSDAGRFMGQIAANLAIERLQIKLMSLCAEHFGDTVALLLFNTHGESLGRGCARPTIKDRQNFILTPLARSRAQELGVQIYHQSSFQGGDGYRLFGSPELANATFTSLLLAEIEPVSDEWKNDPFYSQHEFSLDLFLSLKNWHEMLFADPQYGAMLDVFGSNLLPKTGSRPAKRVVQAGSERQDPSKIRAIPHNAILQQLGFLAIVISGMGSAAQIDSDRFAEIFADSPRLRQAMNHVAQAKHLGSLNTVLAYARLMDNGFWIGRAYHGTQHGNQRAYRLLAENLRQSGAATAIRQTVWKLREDLIDLYRLSEQLEIGSVRTVGDERIQPDLLHAVRIALIMDSLIRVSQVPRFAESNRHSNADMMAAAIRLDFETVCEIVEIEFPNSADVQQPPLAEPETYVADNPAGYSRTRDHLLTPLRRNQALIKQITQMISALHGAHG